MKLASHGEEFTMPSKLNQQFMLVQNGSGTATLDTKNNLGMFVLMATHLVFGQKYVRI